MTTGLNYNKMHKFVDKNLHLVAIFSHRNIIFLNKLMVYGVVQQVNGVVSPDRVFIVKEKFIRIYILAIILPNPA